MTNQDLALSEILKREVFSALLRSNIPYGEVKQIMAFADKLEAERLSGPVTGATAERVAVAAGRAVAADNEAQKRIKELEETIHQLSEEKEEVVRLQSAAERCTIDLMHQLKMEKSAVNKLQEENGDLQRQLKEASTKNTPEQAGCRKCDTQLSDDDWIEWGGGGECPVPEETFLDVRYRDGVTTRRTKAGYRRWTNIDHPADIIAYRLAGESK